MTQPPTSGPPQPGPPTSDDLVPADGQRLVHDPRSRPAPRRPWTGQDFVWWNTAGVLTSLAHRRRPNPVSPVVDPVRRHLGPDEVMLASADAELLLFRRGDATYNPSRGFFLAGGPVGLALTAAFFGGQAYVNSRRKRAAQADAVERWRHLASARVTVSTHGIYIGTGEGVMPVPYADIPEIQLTGVGEVVIAATNARGSARWKLRTQWAELILVLWAAQYMPEHPQLAGATWLPGDWMLHAAAHGYDVDVASWPAWTQPRLRA